MFCFCVCRNFFYFALVCDSHLRTNFPADLLYNGYTIYISMLDFVSVFLKLSLLFCVKVAIVSLPSSFLSRSFFLLFFKKKINHSAPFCKRSYATVLPLNCNPESFRDLLFLLSTMLCDLSTKS